VEVITPDGFGRASAPSGASRGRGEVTPYPKGGVDRAVELVRSLIAPELIGLNADEQVEIDSTLHEIDGTEDFSRIGGNTACAISLATAEAAASSLGIPLFRHLAGCLPSRLPYPLGNVLGGGKHARGRGPDIQEFLVLPVGARSFLEAARVNVEVHRRVGSLLREVDPGFAGGRDDEGAWASNLGNEQALDVVVRACEEVSDELGVECEVGIDMAASTLWNPEKGRYVYVQDGVERDPGEQLEFVAQLIERFRLAYVEDPLHEEDFEGFAELTRRFRDCLICGDDLFVTSEGRLSRGARLGAGNAIIIKPNQVGTITDTWRTTRKAFRSGYVAVMSHRSGDTVDPHLAHLAVAFQCPIIKTGVVGGSRIAKINELLRIEEMLGERAGMARLRL